MNTINNITLTPRIISRSTLVGTANNDTLTATSSTLAYNLYGYAGNDVLNGNAKDDSLLGGDGNDTLNGNAGNDTLNGGAGIDAVVYANTLFSDAVIEDARGFVSINTPTGGTDTLSSIETMQFKNRTVSTVDYYREKYGEFKINTTTNGNQSESNITTLADGSFIVTWSSNQSGTSDIYAQHVDANGKTIGNEFRVNTYLIDNQSASTVAALNDGSYIVTWNSNGQDGDLGGVYQRHYSADDKPIANETLVNSTTINNQSNLYLTYLDTGGFVATWQSYDIGNSNWDIYGQRYAPNGLAVGSEFIINSYNNYVYNDGHNYTQYAYSNQSNSSVSYLNGGGFIVTWQSQYQENHYYTNYYYNGYTNDYGIYAQRYDINGIEVGNEFHINTYTGDDQLSPSITTLIDGSFVITWQSNNQDGDGAGIYGQHFNADGTVIGNEFKVNTYTANANEQSAPAITALADGGFVIVWQSTTQDGDGFGIYAQRYNADGTAAGSEFRVNAYTAGDQTEPSISGLYDGGFVVSYSSTGQEDDSGIFAQRFDAQGNRIILSTNNSPTGDVAITGINKVGALLTATNTLADNDGLGTITYSWYADSTLLSTGNSYTITNNEAGKSIHVIASYTDLLGTQETKSSLNTAAIIGNLEIYGDSGGSKADNLIGGAGNDKLYGLNMNDSLSGGAGDDILYGGYGNDSLIAADGNDQLYGEQDNDYLEGNNGNDTLDGGLGADTLIGGVGNDSYFVDNSGDVISDNGLSSDIDVVNIAVLKSYTLPIGIETGAVASGTQTANITGNTSNNTLTGNDGKNTLNGSTGRDSLFGGAGDDVLMGGTGNDQLEGDGGKDVFKFNTALKANVDKIIDFSPIDDTIQLDHKIFTQLNTLGVLNSANFITATAAVDNNDYIIYDKAKGILFYDADGSDAGAAIQIAVIGINLAITNVDFVVV